MLIYIKFHICSNIPSNGQNSSYGTTRKWSRIRCIFLSVWFVVECTGSLAGEFLAKRTPAHCVCTCICVYRLGQVSIDRGGCAGTSRQERTNISGPAMPGRKRSEQEKGAWFAGRWVHGRKSRPLGLFECHVGATGAPILLRIGSLLVVFFFTDTSSFSLFSAGKNGGQNAFLFRVKFQVCNYGTTLCKAVSCLNEEKESSVLRKYFVSTRIQCHTRVLSRCIQWSKKTRKKWL